MALDLLEHLDGTGYRVLEAITHAQAPSSGTHANPHKFVCIDGRSYWLKGRSQQGLASELIGGRLAALVGAGPDAQVIRLVEEAVPSGLLPAIQGAGLLGVVVGIADLPGTQNARDLGPLLGTGAFGPGLIDPASRARVIAFQSWLGVGDAQVLVSLQHGTVYSIDHGDVFASTSAQADPAPILVSIPGVSDELGRKPLELRRAVAPIEALRERDLIAAVSAVPGGASWKADRSKRREIVQWLEYRRTRIWAALEPWAIP